MARRSQTTSKKKTNGRTRFASLASALVERASFATRAGLQFGVKRDLYVALGYPRDLEAASYRDRYRRGGIAERIVEAYPRATWAGGATVVENPDPGVDTPFEEATVALFDRLDVWARLLRADILGGLGRYSVLLIGADGNVDTELPNIPGPDGVLYLTPLLEDRASIKSQVEDTTDPRYGLPELYQVTMGKQLTKPVHWTRMLHIAEGLLEDEVYGKPRLRSVWNYLDDLDKIVGGGAEAAWKRMDPGMQLDLDPDVELDADAESALADEVDEYLHGMRRVMRTRGVKLNMLAAAVAGFSTNADSVLQLISATTGIPHRILTGSERGSLASTQDRNNWNDRIAERRREFAVPLVRQLVDRLVVAGALPKPAKYDVVWPEIDELDEAAKAEVSDKLAAANQKQFASEGTVITTANEIRDAVLGLGPIEEVEGFDTKDEPEELRAAAADGNEPEWKAVHRAADRHRQKIMALFLASWVAAGATLASTDLEAALKQGNRDRAVRIVLDALADAEAALAGKLPDKLHATLEDGALASLRAARRRGSWFRAASVADFPLRGAAVEFVATFDAENPLATLWASERSSTLITEVGKGTKAAVRLMIAQGISEGIPPRVLMRQIMGSIGLREDQWKALARFGGKPGTTQAQMQRYAKKLRRARALLIARTETMNAANQGQRQLWQQSIARGDMPADTKRVWIATGDDRTRPEHAEMDGEVVGINEDFSIGLDPGEAPNCRCGQGVATPEDIKRAPTRPSAGPAGETIGDDLLGLIDIGDEGKDWSAAFNASSVWRDSLSARERAALTSYRDRGGFRAINDYGRGGTGGPAVRKQLRALEEALDRAAIPDEMFLYRGMSFSSAAEAESFIGSLELGATISDGGFVSMSPSTSIAGAFAATEDVGVFFRLRTLRARGAYIAEAGAEPEYLLQRLSDLKIEQVHRLLSGHIVVDGTIGL